MKLKIGELSKMTGIATATIHYYENAGLMKASWRTSGQFRLYDDEVIDRLAFIRFSRNQGLSYATLKKLLALRDNPDEAECMPTGFLEAQIRNTEKELRLLEHYHEELQDLLETQKKREREMARSSEKSVEAAEE